jgi:glycosyltransferase involved in cell wall biosynthesis
MKVIQIPFCFHPDPIGGTEVYVEALTRHLQEQGIQAVVAAPGERSAAYRHEGLSVRRFAVAQTVTDLRDLYGNGDALAAQSFARILDEEHPDLVHLHAFTQGVSVRLVREAKDRGIPTLFTYHTPTVSCQRGTLMRWGREACNGRLDLDLCTRCTLHGLGLPRPVSDIVGRVPVAFGELLGTARRSGGTWTALRMRTLVRVRHDAFRTLMADVTHVVALCQWTKALLLRDGVPSDKITVSPHGLPQLPGEEGMNSWKARKRGGYSAEEGKESQKDNEHSSIRVAQLSSRPLAQRPLRIAFLGRLDPIKGPDILIQALQLLPEAAIKLHLYGVVQGSAGAAYLQQLKKLAVRDPRVTFLPVVPSDQVTSLLKDYHLLAVPSRGLETGPLVVLEAFATGIPVIGSNLGGIAELVEHEVNGLLVEPGSVAAWSQALQRLLVDRRLLVRLRTGIRPPRSMKVVAKEMGALYHMILGTGKLAGREAG